MPCKTPQKELKTMIHRGRFIPTLDSKHSKGLINVAGERERERERGGGEGAYYSLWPYLDFLHITTLALHSKQHKHCPSATQWAGREIRICVFTNRYRYKMYTTKNIYNLQLGPASIIIISQAKYSQLLLFPGIWHGGLCWFERGWLLETLDDCVANDETV